MENIKATGLKWHSGVFGGSVVSRDITNGVKPDSEGYYIYNASYSVPRVYTDLELVSYSEFDEKSKDKTLSYIAVYPWSDGSTTPKQSSDFRYDNLKADVNSDNDILHGVWPDEIKAYYKRYIISVQLILDQNLIKNLSNPFAD
jgi:hypothetical protein